MLVVTWDAAVRAYLERRRARRSLADLSRREYRYILTDLAAHLDGVPFDVAGHDLVAQVDAWLAARRWSASTCCTNLGIVRPFLVWAEQNRIIAHGAAAAEGLRNPRRPKPLPRALGPAQVNALLAVVPDARGRVIVLLEGQCGLRRGEVAALRMTDVDLADGAILVRGKGGVERMVYPSEETIDAIRVWLRERGSAPGPFICRLDANRAHPAGEALTPTWIGMLVSSWMTAAGLKAAPGDGVSGHALRHTAATGLLRGGANIRVVQDALGHANITTTARYLRADDAEVRAAMSHLSYGRRLIAVPADGTRSD